MGRTYWPAWRWMDICIAILLLVGMSCYKIICGMDAVDWRILDAYAYGGITEWLTSSPHGNDEFFSIIAIFRQQWINELDLALPVSTILQIRRELVVRRTPLRCIPSSWNIDVSSRMHRRHTLCSSECQNVVLSYESHFNMNEHMVAYARRYHGERYRPDCFASCHGAMGCGQKCFKVVWRCHQLLSGFLTNGTLPRVPRQSRLSVNDKGDNDVVPGATNGSPGIYLTSNKMPGKP